MPERRQRVASLKRITTRKRRRPRLAAVRPTGPPPSKRSMAAEGNKRLHRPPSSAAVTEFYVTGFGKFASVPHNPTTDLARGVQNFFAESTRAAVERRERGVVLADARVLEVSAVAVREAVQDLCQQCRARDAARGDQTPAVRSCFLHLGVDASSPDMALERNAFNTAVFRFPDERGYQPTVPVPVVEVDAMYRRRSCDELALQRVLRHLLETPDLQMPHRIRMRISESAGQFLCNFTYYLSLKMVQDEAHGRWQSLFLHCPPAQVISVPDQLAFVLALMRAIAQVNAEQVADAKEAAPTEVPAPEVTADGAHLGQANATVSFTS
ncbi:hypothetical protein CDCA_CDCA17G4321 [Cyanidium caldarium]|uniref:Pyrrolidone-carboxylate peptidase n=1 Tax=Cyanidium caldarium TaxID=2771 RepID=A0AAV9J1P6_CYACA|nr:hypothetical protein CDCA_CDCA17G4321 [Cyanidium caldarium]